MSGGHGFLRCPLPRRCCQIENDGRNVLNEADVLPLLRAYEGGRGFRVVQFDHTKVRMGTFAGLPPVMFTLLRLRSQHPTLESLFAFFGSARMLIGPHGGASGRLLKARSSLVPHPFVALFRLPDER